MDSGFRGLGFRVVTHSATKIMGSRWVKGSGVSSVPKLTSELPALIYKVRHWTFTAELYTCSMLEHALSYNPEPKPYTLSFLISLKDSEGSPTEFPNYAQSI